LRHALHEVAEGLDDDGDMRAVETLIVVERSMPT
jgi:hypothetical protein